MRLGSGSWGSGVEVWEVGCFFACSRLSCDVELHGGFWKAGALGGSSDSIDVLWRTDFQVRNRTPLRIWKPGSQAGTACMAAVLHEGPSFTLYSILAGR